MESLFLAIMEHVFLKNDNLTIIDFDLIVNIV